MLAAFVQYLRPVWSLDSVSVELLVSPEVLVCSFLDVVVVASGSSVKAY